MRNRTYFVKIVVVISMAVILGMTGSTASNYSSEIGKEQTSIALSTFTIENPPVDFEVVDADPFDGFGDNGPYATFNDALLGTLGECRSMAEFDISAFTIPPGEIISVATFEVMITAIDISGLGVDGETPERLAVDGYIGNGLAELSDFEAGDGNVLDVVDTPDPQIGQVLSFTVTSFVIDLVNAQEQYVGLTIRADTFGGLWVSEGGVFPKLTIETIPQPQPDLDCTGFLTWDAVKPGSTVTGNITVENNGQGGSFLNWHVATWPSWGDWTFVPSNGIGLPDGNGICVGVTVVAPDEKNTGFSGNVTIVNTDNSSDYCIIDVYLKTPLNEARYFQEVLDKFFQCFPNAFSVLRQLMGNR